METAGWGALTPTVTTDELKKDPGQGGLHEGGTRTPIRHQEEVMQTPVDHKTALELEAEQKKRETENAKRCNLDRSIGGHRGAFEKVD